MPLLAVRSPQKSCSAPSCIPNAGELRAQLTPHYRTHTSVYSCVEAVSFQLAASILHAVSSPVLPTTRAAAVSRWRLARDSHSAEIIVCAAKHVGRPVLRSRQRATGYSHADSLAALVDCQFTTVLLFAPRACVCTRRCRPLAAVHTDKTGCLGWSCYCALRCLASSFSFHVPLLCFLFRQTCVSVLSCR